MTESQIREIDASDAELQELRGEIVLTFRGPSPALNALIAASQRREVVRVLTSGNGMVGLPSVQQIGDPAIIRVISAH